MKGWRHELPRKIVQPKLLYPSMPDDLHPSIATTTDDDDGRADGGDGRTDDDDNDDGQTDGRRRRTRIRICGRIKKQRRYARLAATNEFIPVVAFLTSLAEHFSNLKHR